MYGAVPGTVGAPRSDGDTFFDLHLYFAEKCCENFESIKGHAHCKSGPGNKMTEQIIEFEFTGPEPPGRTCTPTNV